MNDTRVRSAKREVWLVITPCVVLICGCDRTERGLQEESEGIAERSASALEGPTVGSGAPETMNSAGWRIATEPTFSLNTAFGVTPIEWHDIRGVERLSDGRIVVANRGSLQAFILRADGSVDASLGGRGQGPGEFRDLAWLQVLPADSLMIYDGFGARVSYFSSEGELLETVRIGQADVKGRLEDGTFVSSWNARVNMPALGVYRERQIIRRHDARGRVLATLDTVDGTEGAVLRRPAGGTVTFIDVRPSVLERLPIRQFWMVVGRRHVYLSAGGPEIMVYPAEGGSPSTIHREYPEVAFDAEAVARAGLSQLGAAFLDLPEEARPAVMPATALFLVDNLDHVWVQTYPYDLSAPTSWSVFDSGGQLVSELEMPSRFEPFDIGEDYVLGVWRDALDVEHVRLHDLDRR